MTIELTRKRLLQGGAAAAGGMVIGGSLGSLTARTARGQEPESAPGYGPLQPTPAEDTGVVHIALPAGFSYRVISRERDPSRAFVTDPATGETSEQTVPTPGIFDGMGAYRGRGGDTILIRNHENRRQGGELPVIVPADKRYDPKRSTRATRGWS